MHDRQKRAEVEENDEDPYSERNGAQVSQMLKKSLPINQILSSEIKKKNKSSESAENVFRI